MNSTARGPCGRAGQGRAGQRSATGLRYSYSSLASARESIGRGRHYQNLTDARASASDRSDLIWTEFMCGFAPWANCDRSDELLRSARHILYICSTDHMYTPLFQHYCIQYYELRLTLVNTANIRALQWTANTSTSIQNIDDYSISFSFSIETKSEKRNVPVLVRLERTKYNQQFIQKKSF